MAFRISILEKSGQRSQTTLIEQGQNGVIGATKECNLVCPELGSGKITISEIDGKLSIHPIQVLVSSKETSWTNEAKVVGGSTLFTVGNQKFYATITISNEPSTRKKSYLAALAICLIWTFLALTILIPLWLPQKIQSHKIRSKFVLLENCATQIDTLRRKIKDQQKLISEQSPVQRDILSKITEEVEQIAWIFRSNGEYMSKAQLENLEKDLSEYEKLILHSMKTQQINLSPLSIDKAVETLIKSTQ